MIGLTLEAEDAARYAEVRAEVMARLAAGILETEKGRRLACGIHYKPSPGHLPPAVVRFADRIHDACDPGSYLTTAEAARAAGVSENTAKQWIERLKDARCWPYRSRR